MVQIQVRLALFFKGCVENQCALISGNYVIDDQMLGYPVKGKKKKREGIKDFTSGCSRQAGRLKKKGRTLSGLHICTSGLY